MITKDFKNTRGITLIALIVSIIVLLILAGISMLLVRGENGLLNQSRYSVDNTRFSKAKEEVLMAWSGVSGQYWTEWSRNTSIDRTTYFTKERLNNYLKDTGEVINEPETTYSNGSYIVEYKSKEQNELYKFMIDEQGNLSEVSEISIETEVEELLPYESSKISVVKISRDLLNKDIIWETSDENVLKISGNGMTVNLTAISSGTAEIKARIGDKISNTCTVKVLNSEFIIESEVEEILQDESSIISVSKISRNLLNKDIIWETSDESKLIVSGNGMTANLTGISGGLVKIKAKVGDQISNECTIKILNKVSSLNDFEDLSIEKGKTFQLNIPEYTENVTYSPKENDYISISDSGLITAKNKTQSPVNVTIIGDSGTTKSFSINVTKSNLALDNLSANKKQYVKCGSMLCIVLYNDEEHGLQVITEAPIADSSYTIGDKDSHSNALDSYNSAVSNLNQKATSYKVGSLTVDARCVGSLPTISDSYVFDRKDYPDNPYGEEFNYFVSNQAYISRYSGKYFMTDTNYTQDFEKLKNLNALESSINRKSYWLASRNVAASVTGLGRYYYIVRFHVRTYEMYSSSSGIQNNEVAQYRHDSYTGDDTYQSQKTSLIRPVFLINKRSKIKEGGEGTVKNPYELYL